MHTIAIGFGGKISAVVHNQGDIMVMADGPQPVCNIENDVIIHVLDPKLYACDIATIEGRCESIGKR